MLVRLWNDEANFRNLINKPCIIRKLYDTSERSTCLCFSRLTIPAEDTGASKTSVIGEATGPPETTRGLAGVPTGGGELQDGSRPCRAPPRAHVQTGLTAGLQR